MSYDAQSHKRRASKVSICEVHKWRQDRHGSPPADGSQRIGRGNTNLGGIVLAKRRRERVHGFGTADFREGPRSVVPNPGIGVLQRAHQFQDGRDVFQLSQRLRGGHANPGRFVVDGGYQGGEDTVILQIGEALDSSAPDFLARIMKSVQQQVCAFGIPKVSGDPDCRLARLRTGIFQQTLNVLEHPWMAQ